MNDKLKTNLDVSKSRRKLLKAGALTAPVIATLNTTAFASGAATSISACLGQVYNEFDNRIPTNVGKVIRSRHTSGMTIVRPKSTYYPRFDETNNDHWYYISDLKKSNGTLHSCMTSIIQDTTLQPAYSAYWNRYIRKKTLN